jgi:hypothetical protein
MSIPLDRLYHFIENIAKEINDNIVIYRFYPHGSKNLEHLQELKGPLNWQDKVSKFSVYCHDQEPLNYDLYQNVNRPSAFIEILKSISADVINDNNLMCEPTIYDQVYLIHSEKRSSNLTAYQNHSYRRCIDIYYWSHAIIALDWFRYAKHIKQKKQVNKTFLIYNRAWSGTREYRLKFAEFLIKLGLQDQCYTSVNPVEPELNIHYELHQFKNPAWRPSLVLENFLPVSNAHSHYSADFDIEDYEATDIEVVLETLFDDDRLHLTEKSLRPIALGQPFILAGTHGSLEYLRSYGFKTFGLVWDERYDECADPEERLGRIADLMKQIANWGPWLREQKMAEAKKIAEYNRQHFFNQEFFDLITNELKTNLQVALDQQTPEINDKFISRWEKLLTYNEMLNFLTSSSIIQGPTLNQVIDVLSVAKDLQKLKQ